MFLNSDCSDRTVSVASPEAGSSEWVKSVIGAAETRNELGDPISNRFDCVVPFQLLRRCCNARRGKLGQAAATLLGGMAQNFSCALSQVVRTPHLFIAFLLIAFLLIAFRFGSSS
jgi:hypothetical protein